MLIFWAKKLFCKKGRNTCSNQLDKRQAAEQASLCVGTEGKASYLQGWEVITGGIVREVEEAGPELWNWFWIQAIFFSLAAIHSSAVAAASIKGGGGRRGIEGRAWGGGRRGEWGSSLNINGAIVGRSGAASPLTGVWGAADSSFSSGFSASDCRPSRLFPKESFCSRRRRSGGGFFLSSCSSLHSDHNCL